MTLLQMHADKWKTCTACSYSERRKRVVIGKGRSPCDVLFVGEAPGSSEDTNGVPFDGQSGIVLNDIISRSGIPERKLRVAFTNLLGCIPLSLNKEDRYEKDDKPDHDCIMACQPRLIEFINIVQPTLIVCVGKQADEYFDPSYKDGVTSKKLERVIKQVSVTHPSAILRAPFIQRDQMVQKCVATVKRAVKDQWPEELK